jgi:ubiquinol-cytochrome c reductase cytochrome b subunit
MKRLIDFLDARIGLRHLVSEALDEPVPGGASWAYVFGSAALVLFGVQLVTGVVLATYYAPTVTDAWASVAYLEREIGFGAVVRGLHHHAAGGMVAIVGLHLVQVALFGAYKAPRELNWWSGLALFGLVLAFALTGYLLPWDQTGYWATRVATGIAGTVPLVGGWIQRLVQGGSDYGNLTLTRFYALHVIVLPIACLGLIGAHLALFRRHGITPSPTRSEAALARSEPFWPRQVAYDAVFGLLVVGAVLGLAVRFGAPLEAPADPSSNFIARPEWYFLFLFQLLKYFEGPLQVVGTTVVPGLAAAFLAALPFLDRSPSRAYRGRRGVLAALAVGALGVLALTGLALSHDAGDAQLAAQRGLARREAARARRLASQGVPPAGAAAMMAADPLTRGERLFRKECLSCHTLEGEGPSVREAPDLTGYGSRAWIRQVLRDPDHPRLFGGTRVEGMPSFAELPEADLAVLVDFLYALRSEAPPSAEAGRVGELFEAHECGNCHELEEDAGLEGPALFGYLSPRWLRAVIDDAGADHLYGEANTMPAFAERLTAGDRDALVVFLRSLEARPSFGGGRGDPEGWPWRDPPGPVPTPRARTSTAAAE